MNMLSTVLVLAICLLQFAHTLVVEPKAVGNKNSEVNGDMNGQPTTEFLKEIRQHFERGNIKNERKIRSADSEGIKHGDRIALQSYSRQLWLDCSGSQCTQSICPRVYFEGNDWSTCRDNTFRIYRARGQGEVLVGDLVGIYLQNESGKWLSCRSPICGKNSCPGIATTDHGFAIEEHWYRCYGEVFKIYARGKNISDPIMPKDDVMLNYIQEYKWVQALHSPQKAGCPGSVRPPPAERYDYCFGEVYQIWQNSTAIN